MLHSPLTEEESWASRAVVGNKGSAMPDVTGPNTDLSAKIDASLLCARETGSESENVIIIFSTGTDVSSLEISGLEVAQRLQGSSMLSGNLRLESLDEVAGRSDVQFIEKERTYYAASPLSEASFNRSE